MYIILAQYPYWVLLLSLIKRNLAGCVLCLAVITTQCHRIQAHMTPVTSNNPNAGLTKVYLNAEFFEYWI